MGEPAQVTDNYVQFIARLDAATENLNNRRQSLSKSVAILTLLRDQNLAGMESWEQRRAKTSKLLVEHSQGPEVESLRELLEVALRMQPMFRNRTERIGHRLELLRKRSDELTKSLVALKMSKAKLESSRMLAQERDN
ncbi:hypothetical protein, partial [Microbacterium sp. Bi128]|uniref:hypothetical protein n=1 Tax=Microbacterium sp. Bi128 TaxID=2821115 RepID=UPI001E3AE529